MSLACLVTLGRSKRHCQKSRSLCSSVGAGIRGRPLTPLRRAQGGADPPRQGSPRSPSFLLEGEVAFPGAEAGHTLRKNERAGGRPVPPWCLPRDKLLLGPAGSCSEGGTDVESTQCEAACWVARRGGQWKGPGVEASAQPALGVDREGVGL